MSGSYSHDHYRLQVGQRVSFRLRPSISHQGDDRTGVVTRRRMKAEPEYLVEFKSHLGDTAATWLPESEVWGLKEPA